MNLLHMKYAVEISKTGSISKASENLYVAQPNLSRSLKELEAELGIEIFDRTSKGMKLTPKGEIFIHYAKNVLQQVEDMSKIKNDGKKAKQIFSISVPRASYIADAFAKFTNCLSEDSADIYYMETNPRRIIHNIVDAGYKLGILRYARTITHDEALRLLSNVRLGIVSGQLKDVSLATIDKLMTDVEPATLMVNSGKSLTAAQRDTARADLLRKSLN